MGVKKRKKLRKQFRYRDTAKKRKRRHLNRWKPTIKQPEVQEAWNDNKSVPANLENIGLVYKLGKLGKEDLVPTVEPETSKPKKKKVKVTKTTCIKRLEESAAKKKKQVLGGTRLPKDLVDFSTRMLNKYGFDFKAMAKDPTNYYQDSWKQIRTKIVKFMNNPRHFAEYIKERKSLNLPELPSKEVAGVSISK